MKNNSTETVSVSLSYAANLIPPLSRDGRSLVHIWPAADVAVDDVRKSRTPSTLKGRAIGPTQAAARAANPAIIGNGLQREPENLIGRALSKLRESIQIRPKDRDYPRVERHAMVVHLEGLAAVWVEFQFPPGVVP